MGSDHQHHHDHHDHHHGNGDDFDWEEMADVLELEAAMVRPLVEEVVGALQGQVPWAGVTDVIDLGCGPGVATCMLALHAPHALVTALDSSGPLLGRTRSCAAAAGVGDRVHTLETDLEALPAGLPASDVAWASMVLHHVAQPATVLEAIHSALRAGGTVVMFEFAGPPCVLDAHDPLVAGGAWARLQAATAEVLRGRLGLDPVTVDWPALLHDAGFVDVTDTVRSAHHPAPLDDSARRWLAQHVRRGIEMAGERLAAADVELLSELAGSVDRRDDVFVRAERRVLTARRR